MSIFCVFQNETYKEEREGSYVWSPQLRKDGGTNLGYTKMTEIHKGDYIFHSANRQLLAVSIAATDCYNSAKPKELVKAKTTVDWDIEGYRVDLEYHILDHPLDLKDYREWLIEHYVEKTAFNIKGTGNQRYMNSLPEVHACRLLKDAIALQSDDGLRLFLSGVLDEVIGEKDFEYNALDREEIEEFIQDSDSDEKPEWSGQKEKQAMTFSEKTQNALPKRDVKRAADALKRANYCCEYNLSDRTFLRKNGKSYTEPHHLIPISKYRDFEYSVDVMENIVSLCSHCHNLLHYGRLEDKIPILEKLYNERIEALRVCGLDLTFDQLKSYYK